MDKNTNNIVLKTRDMEIQKSAGLWYHHLFSLVAKEIILILWKRKYLCVDIFEYGYVYVIVQVFKYMGMSTIIFMFVCGGKFFV